MFPGILNVSWCFLGIEALEVVVCSSVVCLRMCRLYFGICVVVLRQMWFDESFLGFVDVFMGIFFYVMGFLGVEVLKVVTVVLLCVLGCIGYILAYCIVVL